MLGSVGHSFAVVDTSEEIGNSVGVVEAIAVLGDTEEYVVALDTVVGGTVDFGSTFVECSALVEFGVAGSEMLELEEAEIG